MIRKLLNTLLNTEYLPMNDVRRVKVIIILIFLTIFTILTIPVSSALNYAFWVKTIFISGFSLGLLFTFVFVRFNKMFLAMQTTIIQSLMFMVYYTQGITSFYAYLLFYIVLTIIALYQEVYSYFIFGAAATILGVFYTFSHGAGLLLVNDLPGALYIYIAGLILYYLVHFVYILINEKTYAEMNLEWIHYKRINDGIQEEIFNYMEAIRRTTGIPPVYEEQEFQEAVFEISEFIAKQLYKDGSEIKNVVDLYFYMHDVGFKTILDNEDISVTMKKVTDNLKKYMINDNSDLFSMLVSLNIKDYPSKIRTNDLVVNKLTEERDEQLIAFALIYVYITHGLYQRSEWSHMNDESLKNLEDFDFEMFFDDYILAFYQDNIDIIKKYLSK